MSRSAKKRHDRPPRRWRRIILITLAVLLLGAGVAEWIASRMVADKLRALVATKLDAKLEIGRLVYLPPFGAWISSARLVRDGKPLVSVARLKLRLAQAPLGDGPIIIASVTANEPVLELQPGSFDRIVRGTPGPAAGGPRKLSELLKLDELRFYDGRVTYRDPKRPGPPMEWSGLSVDMDTTQKSASRYTFHVISRAAPLADASAAGSIDVDDLMLEITSLTLKSRAEPEPQRTPLPAAVQRFLKKHRITGLVSVSGAGSIPLKEAGRASFSLAIAVQDAAARPGGGATEIDRARASFVCRKDAGDAKIIVQLQKLEFGGAGKNVQVDAGEIDLDVARQAWTLGDLRGRVQFEQPGAMIRTTFAPDTQPAIEPKGIDRFQFAGRGDFTARASGPLKLGGRNPWEAIEHEVVLYPRGASFLPKGFVRRIDQIEGGEVRLVNGTIVFQELRGRCVDDVIRLRSARLPVQGLPAVARWQELSGSVTFNPPDHRYSPKLDKILDPLNPRGTFLIAGSYTFDKSDGTRKHEYDLIVSSDAGSFAVGPRRIGVTKIRGDATVTPAGVEVHEASADVLGGKVQFTGRYVRRDESVAAYDGEAHFQDVEVRALEDSLRDEPPARPMEGRIFAETTFSGVTEPGATGTENLRLLQAAGELEVIDGSLFRMPVLKDLAGNVRGMEDVATVGSAAAGFEIRQGVADLKDVAISSPAVGLQGDGKLGLDGAVDLHVVVAPLAEWREKLRETKIPIFSDVAGTVAGGLQKLLNSATGALLYEFRIGGTVKETKVSAVATPVLNDAAAYVFGRMLEPQKAARPREWRRPREPRAQVK